VEDELLAIDMLLVFARLNPLLLPVKSYKRPENLLGMNGKSCEEITKHRFKTCREHPQLPRTDKTHEEKLVTDAKPVASIFNQLRTASLKSRRDSKKTTNTD